MDARMNMRRGGMFALLLAATLVAGCDDALAPPLAIIGTGSIEGLIFFDASEDGVYDAADGDFGVAGVNIAIRNRGTEDDFATATSGADGRFQVTSLPGGTHDMFLDPASVPAGMTICQNPVLVTVIPNEIRFAEVRGRPGCLITIADAKEAAVGEFVIVSGLVTSAPGQIESNFVYIEDETAGLFMFAPGLMGKGIEVGDQIEVGGSTAIVNGVFELGPDASLRRLVKNVATPVPTLTTTGAIAASGSNPLHDLQNRFVRLLAAKITDVFGFGGGNLQNAPLDDGSGGILIRVDDGVTDRNTINSVLTAGACYNINGFASNFFGGAQIFPRSLDDMEEVPCT
ncbi:MAG: hypothetical protein BMS9Abin29_2072 [Gemmatimonadota bacterium]|nr:MAG: hypothetical protein BMS9Abin29_2072 [Gemmatimonadota bacterium]